ncbi:PREDICTED: TATA box-binding protein-associated factor RNA polymerase I subunit A [Myotis davidii]|uniref:TATA box-binding protein-associated factor RNA polymerase I subunit A n=1 Tax=Myotis davidii TaxID=225400 RepID=UPI000767C46E|nr:PREDICTED: TATA box-binding protein-associated factor RNA polymerase I subunit A [Myotis davidii]
MSDFSEDLLRPAPEDDPAETSVRPRSGMRLPWLQKQVESVATRGKKEKDFAQTTSACLSFIQEALLKHQWQRAAEYMHSYLQILEDSDSNKRQAAPEIIWKLGSEILYYHPKSSVETFNTFHSVLCYEDDYAYSTASQNMFKHSWKTSVNFSALVQTPGVWDPFVKSYVEMLEFYGDQDGAREVLTNYAYDGELNREPHELYLKSKLTFEKCLLNVQISQDYFFFQILYQIVPSHTLMLEFHRLLRKSDKEEHHKLGLEVLFGVLDFAGCTKNLTAWQYLAKYLRQILMGSHLAWVQDEWNSRKNWWPGFHFSSFWAKSDWKEDKALAYEKAFVAGILLGKGCRYFRYISKQDHQDLRKKFKRMKKLVKKHSIVNPGP